MTTFPANDLEGRKQMTGVIERRFPQRPDLDAAAAVRGGVLSREPRGNRRDFLLSLIAGHAELESHIRFRPSRAAIFQYAAAGIINFQH